MAATVRTSLSKLFICITMCLATLAIMSDPALGLRCKSDLSCDLSRKCVVIKKKHDGPQPPPGHGPGAFFDTFPPLSTITLFPRS